MDPKEKSGLAAVEVAADAVAKSDHEAAVTNAATKAKADGEKAGVDAAKTRIKAITGAKEAEGRTELANHLAFDTDMAADAAIAVLAKAPKPAKADAAKPASRLDALMATEQPKVDAAESDGATHSAALSAAVTRQLAALGKKPLALH